MKKRYQSFLVLLLLILTIIGCNNADENRSNAINHQSVIEQITIDLAIHAANPKRQEPALYEIIQKFMEQNPDINIIVHGTEQKAHVKKMKMLAQSNDLPDIFWVLPHTSTELNEAGLLLDLSPFIDENRQLIEKFHANMLEPYNDNGQQFGLPYQPLVTGFWYNKAMFDQYNVPLPETYQDMKEAVKLFKEQNIVTIAKGSQDPYSVWAFLTMLSRYGFFDKIDPILAGEESYQNQDFLQFYKNIDELRELGAFPKNVATLNYFQAVQMFLNGDAAMLDAGVWETNKIEESEIAEDVGFWWGPIFKNGIEKQKVSSVVPSAPLVVSSKVKDEDEKYAAVMSFLKFYYSEEGAQIMLDNQVPPMIQFEGEVDEKNHSAFAKVMEQMNQTGWESQPNQPDLVVPSQVGDAINESIYGVINGIYSPEEALAVVSKKITEQNR
ncbi:ABC transporter substrate-binding protein [Bacillus solitudinis]|uniref:ABC transporter substrate-binding protein n=1 Tax=Bacillus solitudinis TaxID=2014074 RepID=UPI000C24F58E|nr:extracellular solute-binding protein [Bacillus solitudinis]